MSRAYDDVMSVSSGHGSVVNLVSSEDENVVDLVSSEDDSIDSVSEDDKSATENSYVDEDEDNESGMDNNYVDEDDEYPANHPNRDLNRFDTSLQRQGPPQRFIVLDDLTLLFINEAVANYMSKITFDPNELAKEILLHAFGYEETYEAFDVNESPAVLLVHGRIAAAVSSLKSKNISYKKWDLTAILTSACTGTDVGIEVLPDLFYISNRQQLINDSDLVIGVS
jgi:hypothetical protein